MGYLGEVEEEEDGEDSETESEPLPLTCFRRLVTEPLFVHPGRLELLKELGEGDFAIIEEARMELDVDILPRQTTRVGRDGPLHPRCAGFRCARRMRFIAGPSYH